MQQQEIEECSNSLVMWKIWKQIERRMNRSQQPDQQFLIQTLQVLHLHHHHQAQVHPLEVLVLLISLVVLKVSSLITQLMLSIQMNWIDKHFQSLTQCWRQWVAKVISMRILRRTMLYQILLCLHNLKRQSKLKSKDPLKHFQITSEQ